MSINKGWEKSFILIQTYNNLRVGIAQFFHYAKNVLKSQHPPAYIPFSFSNTSSVEATFSHARAMDADTPRKYGNNILATDSMKTILTRNKMYDFDSTQQNKNVSFDDITGTKMYMKQNKIRNWMKLPEEKNQTEIIVPIINKETVITTINIRGIKIKDEKRDYF